MNFGPAVSVWLGRLYGYNFRFIPHPGERERFMTALKSSVPLKMWDPTSKRWWVPELYAHIAESVAQEAGALLVGDLRNVRAYRSLPAHFESDMANLGLLPSAPLRLAEMAWMYWQAALNTNSLASADLESKRDAWARIQAHFADVDAGKLTEPQP